MTNKEEESIVTAELSNGKLHGNNFCRFGGIPTKRQSIYIPEQQEQQVPTVMERMMKMKKWIAMILMAVMVLGLLTACGNTNGVSENQPTPTTAAQPSDKDEKQDAALTEGAKQDAALTEDAKQDGVKPEDKEEGSAENVAPAQKADISVAVMKGPTAIGMVKLMEENEAGNAANNYSFMVAGAADEISPLLIKGELQMAAVPCNLASVLYNKTEGKITMLAVNTLGVLYIVETGDSIRSVADLKGKTIYSTGKGTTPEYTLRYLLSAAGIDPDKDVTIEFKSEATEIAALLTDADDAIAMLPQPYVTTVMMNNDKVRIALDVTKEWENLTNGESSVVTGVIVAQKSFVEENKEAVDAFLAEYAESTLYANEQTEAAAELVEKYGIFKAAVAKKAIPYCNIVCIQGDEMEAKAGAYLNTLYEQAPNSVGGKLPATDFFYKK